ncbi:MAG: hypothetical protein LAT64_13360 [Phycisphaerales bacterium]|nr:hypothetical protein [Planctomycetota bacterium]MCH8509743.1 hypothetical protein [Phycisphaerales bacterium]
MIRFSVLSALLLASGAAAGVEPFTVDPEDPIALEVEFNGLTNPIERRALALNVSSGEVRPEPRPRGLEGRPAQVPVWSTEIEVPDAGWIRLRFGEVQLAPATEFARESYLRITSLYDGHEQYLDRQSLAEWQYTSAYFNGGRVRVEIMASPGNLAGVNSVQVTGATVSEPTIMPRSICGTTDDRILSNDPRAARLMPIGCTAWLFGNQPHSMITAGHCGPAAGSVVQFNVPLSTSSGTPQNPPPEDQYPIDMVSVQRQSGGVGIDWAFFGAFANANTGLAPRDAMGDSYILTATVPPADSRPIRITGYGTVSSPVPQTWRLAQKTHVGPFVVNSGNTLRYATDTTGGNSGSAVLDENNNRAIGVHTHAGCTSTGGSNQGTSLNNPNFQDALNNPLGITIPLGLDLQFLSERPNFVHPNGGDEFSIIVAPDNGRDPSGVVTMWVDTGSGFSPLAMQHAGGDVYTGAFPPADCGIELSFYFTAQDTAGSTWFLPDNAPDAALRTTVAANMTIAISDDFEQDLGWTVENHTSLTAGAWERAVPGNYGRFDPPHDADGSGKCYVTDNRPLEDVDGGPTYLISPTMDLSGYDDPRVSYARWHRSNGNDPFRFQISNNGGASWITVETVLNSIDWNWMEFRIADFIEPTGTMIFRFSSEDNPNNAITESGVDAFRVFDIACTDACPADITGDGQVNFFDLAAFMDLFNDQDPAADLNQDGLFNFFDVSIYLDLYNAGCP